MGLPDQAIEAVPEETAQVARKAFPKGNSYIQMRDALGTIYTDDIFANLYPQNGQPAVRLGVWRW
jgi:transposase